MHKVDVIAQYTPEERRTRRGTYMATITVGGAFVEFEGAYELSDSALVRETIESRLRALVGVSISLTEADKEAE